MIATLDHISFELVEGIKKGLILCSPDDREKVTGVIKQWIAHILSKYYDGDSQKMIEAKEYTLQFQCVNWLDKIIIISKD